MRKIAGFGLRPQFSPDGNWITYHVGGFGADFSGNSKSYIVASTGGSPRQLQPAFSVVRSPTWSPNGRYLLFYGIRDWNAAPDSGEDWWVAPADGGEAVQTGAYQILRTRGLLGYEKPGVWLTDDRLVFSASVGDSRNLWEIGISSKTGRITGDPRRLTFGTTLEEFPSGAGSGRLVFASLNENLDIWSLPCDTNRGTAAEQSCGGQAGAGPHVGSRTDVSARSGD